MFTDKHHRLDHFAGLYLVNRMAEYDDQTRSIIVNYRFRDLLSYAEISRKIEGTTASGCRMLCERARERANSDNIADILQNCRVLPRDGAPVRVQPGSQASIAIRRAIRGKHRYQNETEAANRVYKKQRPKSDRKPLQPLNVKQVHNILRGRAHSNADPLDKRPITRKRCLTKKRLTAINLAERKAYCDKLLSMQSSDYLLICVDETRIDFGGCSGHARGSAPLGMNIYASDYDPRFSKMQWAAASSDTRIERPHHIWTPEDHVLSEELRTKFEQAKLQLRQEVDRQRQASLIEGTSEQRYLQSLNNQVDVENARRRLEGVQGRKQRFKPERAFKYETLERDHLKGGLDFVYYSFELYEKRLFPYYLALQRLNPSRTVLITEDNVGVHHKARKLLAPLIKQLNIQFLDLPANSSDYHPIEQLHKDQKKELEDYRFSIESAAQEIQHDAEREMRRIWCQDTGFNYIVATKADIEAYKMLAKRSMHAETPYSNNYDDSI